MTISRQWLSDLGTCVAILSIKLILATSQTQDSCVVVGPEIPDYHVEGEAVIIRFPFLEDAVRYRKLRLDNSSTFHVNHTNLSNQSSLELWRDRVKQSERGVLLLPSHPSDSGTFSYILRSDTFCLMGSISITVSEKPDLSIMPFNTLAGGDVKINCPHLKHFRWTENPKWYKDFQSTALPVGGGRHSIEKGIILAIRNISVKDEGFYTCRLTVIVNNTQYNVSRTWSVQVSVLDAESASPTTLTSSSLGAVTSSGSSSPYFVSPVNGSFIESRSGSRLVIRCVVSIGSMSAQSTDVTWLVNGQTVENSHLGGRTLQSVKRVTGSFLEVQLEISKLQEEDSGTELKCIWKNHEQKQEAVAHIKLADSESWWLVAAVISACFLLVLCVFARQLCQRPQKRGDYFLARQNSSV